MTENNSGCIIILGMYRSGASALAGCLKLLGGNPGENIGAPVQKSDGGYFENNDLILVHDILLRDLGCKWDMVGGLPPTWQKSEAADRARKSIKTILERSYSPDELWVIKDPRMCRLMPLWEPLFREMEINPGLVLNLRHPLETARSLAKEHGFDLRKNFLLWLFHYREAFSACWNNSSVVITYDQLLADPISTLKFISESLDFTYPKSLQNNYQEIIDFVRPELKHEASGQPQNDEEGQFEYFNHLYEQIRQICVIKTGQLTAKEGEEHEVIQYNKDLLPSVLQQLSPESSLQALQNSKKEKTVLASAHIFNDILSLVGDHERTLHSVRLEKERRLLTAFKSTTTLFAQFYFPQEQGDLFTEEKSRKILLAPFEWQELTVPLPDPVLIKNKGLRLDPLNSNGIVHISSVNLVNPATGESVFKIEKPDQFQICQIEKDAFLLSAKDGLTLFVFNNDPRIILPPMPDLPDCPLEIRVWIKVQTSQDEMKTFWTHEQERGKQLDTELAETHKQLETAQAQIAQDQERGKQLDTDLAEAHEQLETAQAQITHDQERGKQLDTELAEARKQLETAQAQITHDQERGKQLDTDLAETRKQLETAQAQIAHDQERGKQLDTELAEARKQLETAQTQITQDQERGKQLDTDFAETRKQLGIARTKITKNKKRTQQLDTELAEARKQLEIAQTQITQEQERTQQLESSLSEVQKQAADAQAQIQRERERIRQLNLENFRLSSSCYSYTEKNEQLESWMEQLHHDFNALLSSKRWRIGNMVVRAIKADFSGNKKPGSLCHARQIFREFTSGQEKPENNPQPRQSWDSGQKIPVEQLMQQLENDISALSESTRYKTGKILGRIPGIMLLRGKPRLAIDHMLEIFHEYHSKQQQGEGVTSEQIENWIQQLNTVFESFLASNRWRAGNNLIRGLERVLLRKKKPMATEHVMALFADFNRGRYMVGNQPIERINSEDFSLPGKYASVEQATGEPYTLRKPV